MPSLWRGPVDLGALNQATKGTLVEALGIEFVEAGEDFLAARMPVDERTRQPFGVLHGGASAALAETVASAASILAVDSARFRCVGLEINANHIRSVADGGFVRAECRPLHVGRSTHVWEIRISDDAGRLACAARLTVAVVPLAAPEDPWPTTTSAR
ncbi:MAG: hotdog fold thioesterase [Candidatus Polarisedimenticolia bacterium]|nr:hotdog fold thioesterase [bacterium]